MIRRVWLVVLLWACATDLDPPRTDAPVCDADVQCNMDRPCGPQRACAAGRCEARASLPAKLCDGGTRVSPGDAAGPAARDEDGG